MLQNIHFRVELPKYLGSSQNYNHLTFFDSVRNNLLKLTYVTKMNLLLIYGYVVDINNFLLVRLN